MPDLVIQFDVPLAGGDSSDLLCNALYANHEEARAAELLSIAVVCQCFMGNRGMSARVALESSNSRIGHTAFRYFSPRPLPCGRPTGCPR